MPLDDVGFRDRIGPLDKIERVILLLAREEWWCKGELVTADGRRCIMGAVQEVDGVKVLAPPILAAIQQVTGRRFYPRIEMFNDDPATNHPLVLEVLFRARENIIAGISGDRRAGSSRSPHRLLPLIGWLRELAAARISAHTQYAEEQRQRRSAP
jgi:hypothetical protein